jgi:hypothetical protein
MKNGILKKMVTPKEAAETYGWSEGTLANLRHRKLGPKYYRVGKRKVLYRVEDIEAWVYGNPVLTADSLPEK